MKQSIFYVLAFMLTFGMISCSSDDDKGSESATILGKWYISQNGYILNGTEILEDYDHECATKKDFVEFFNDGTVKDSYYDTACVVDTDTGTYTLDGNTLVVSYMYDGEIDTQQATIVTLNETTLKFNITEVYDGVTYTYVSVLTR